MAYLSKSYFVIKTFSDVNECQASNGGCEQLCTNTDGSFQCSCRTGYSLSSDGLSCNGKASNRVTVAYLSKSYFVIKTFSDVNECQASNGGCEQVCTNTDGSFQCSCRTGYSLSSDGLNCNGIYCKNGILGYLSFTNNIMLATRYNYYIDLS